MGSESEDTGDSLDEIARRVESEIHKNAIILEQLELDSDDSVGIQIPVVDAT